MLNNAILLFAVASAGGIVLANSLLRGLFVPLFVSLLHAVAGLCGLFVVFVAVLQPDSGYGINLALWILVVAALAGLGVTRKRMGGTSTPVRLVIVHASLTIMGFAILLLAARG